MHSRAATRKAPKAKVAKKVAPVQKRKISTRKTVQKPTMTTSSATAPMFSSIKKPAPFAMTRFARGMSTLNTPGNILFTKDHEYIRFDTPTTAFVGISHHAQELLGDIVYFDAPAVGTDPKKGSSFAAVESVKASSDIFAPVSMKVLKINPKLEAQLELINQDAEGEGWLVHAEVVDAGEFESLMNKDQYGKYLETLDH